MSAPPRHRSVRLRCGSPGCGWPLDRAENGIRGWYVLGGREDDMIFARCTAVSVAYRCGRCGHEHEISLDRVAELAPRAYELRRDLLAGLRDYGLPPR